MVTVGIATSGRPEILGLLLKRLEEQTCKADEVIIVASKLSDIPTAASQYQNITALIDEGGLTAKRNRILDRAQNSDYIFFFDDDFVPDNAFIESMAKEFDQDLTIVAQTGLVVRDGITTEGIDFFEAIKALESHAETINNELKQTSCSVYNAYGCNMAFRGIVIKSNGITFDENLPLYGWLEDVDFSRSIAKYGKIQYNPYAKGVHLGTKLSRQSGVRFGFSQIVNPIYLSMKGTMSWRRALAQISRNLAMNVFKSVSPEPYVDRKGRLIGNFKGVLSVLKGDINPRNILVLD